LDFKTRQLKSLPEKEIIELRTSLLNASALAGMAISHTRTALAHAISYPLTLEFDIPHGLACSFTLPKLVERNKQLLIALTKRQELVDALEVLLSQINFHSELEHYAPRKAILDLVAKQNLKPDRLGNFDGIYGAAPVEIISESLV
jgi:alcohol dehydrogenase